MKLPSVSFDKSTSELTLDTTNKSPTPEHTKTSVLSSMMKRLTELEEKVDMLKSKPSEMPWQKAELLNAAVCRVDGLEAELIATKKVGCFNFVLHYIYKKLQSR